MTVIVFNFSSKFVEIEKSTRFAQIIFWKVAEPTLREVKNSRTKLKGIQICLVRLALDLNMPDKILTNVFLNMFQKICPGTSGAVF